MARREDWQDLRKFRSWFRISPIHDAWNWRSSRTSSARISTRSRPRTPMTDLGRELGLSQEEIGRRTGKDRTSITNMLRLLRLPDEVQLLLAEHRLFMGHARAILALDSAEEQIRAGRKDRRPRTVRPPSGDAGSGSYLRPTQTRRQAEARRAQDPNVSGGRRGDGAGSRNPGPDRRVERSTGTGSKSSTIPRPSWIACSNTSWESGK